MTLTSGIFSGIIFAKNRVQNLLSRMYINGN